MNQLDLFGLPLSQKKRVELTAHLLRFHKVKYYKKCAGKTLDENGRSIDCDKPVVNKPYNHYCVDHLLSFYILNDIIKPIIEVEIKC